MAHPRLAVITGAFGYTGRYVARNLVGQGVRVKTLTRRRADQNPFGDLVQAIPLDFSDPDGLCRSMQGADVLYNTYWIRYERGQITFDHVVKNTKSLFHAAKRAAVGKIVHLSVTNASAESELAYFKGKGQVEEMLMSLGVSYSVIRPTLVFGDGDLLLNNMAWALRRFPIFPVYGSGEYPIQPVYVEDLAAQAVEAGSRADDSIADAAGPETFTFKELLLMLASTMGVRRWIVPSPPKVGLALTQLVGWLMHDLALTSDEVVGLMAGLLTSKIAPTGKTRLGDWLKDNSDGLGRRYVSELRRNWR